ncbi:MAG: TetR/AcrR family transcriptional regulator [Candidatus Delongbacteria bacterium]|jgi:TetR/AcrR family fatty acid metabolism transcriptional regulator|nr:TetR/AcrR family transcriptional regulator [Candidatus Delongbacteria bacterium]MDY0016637.1 TetR/AcrR family transcriptional regulator [Candidatus Delongbacteria bacterium]
MAVSKIKTREIEMKKQIILEEAAKLIDKVGFKNAKMEDIAHNVGFSKGSLYSYFRDKEEIAVNIAGQHLQKFYNKISGLLEMDLTAKDKLELMKNAHMEFIKRSKNLMIIKPNYQIKEKSRVEFIELKLKTFEVLKSILTQGISEKKFNKDLNTDYAANLLDAMFIGIVFINSMIINIKPDFTQTKDFNMEEMISYAMDFFYLGITNTNTGEK